MLLPRISPAEVGLSYTASSAEQFNRIYKENPAKMKSLAPRIGIVSSLFLASVKDAFIHLVYGGGKIFTGVLITPYNIAAGTFFPKWKASPNYELKSAFNHFIDVVNSLFSAAILPLLSLLSPIYPYRLIQDRQGAKEKNVAPLQDLRENQQISHGLDQQAIIEQLKVDLEHAKADLEHARSQVSPQQGDAPLLETLQKQTEIDQLKRELEIVKGELENAKSSSSSQGEELRQLKSDLENQKTAYDTTKSELETLQNKIAVQKQKLAPFYSFISPTNDEEFPDKCIKIMNLLNETVQLHLNLKADFAILQQRFNKACEANLKWQAHCEELNQVIAHYEKILNDNNLLDQSQREKNKSEIVKQNLLTRFNKLLQESTQLDKEVKKNKKELEALNDDFLSNISGIENINDNSINL